MSSFLFLIVMDWIMKKTAGNHNNGIRWNFTTVLEDSTLENQAVN